MFGLQTIPGCRCTEVGCLCPHGTATAAQVRAMTNLCEQVATAEDGLCNRCRTHLKNGHGR